MQGTAEFSRGQAWRRSVEQVRTNTCPVFSIHTRPWLFYGHWALSGIGTIGLGEAGLADVLALVRAWFERVVRRVTKVRGIAIQ
jgi:hypothetical protein